ncbi:hypothetical protein [Brenneria roseae]|uniref:hypothetical protein n=1 Tax=Brenneria roseae TaxID=1509241 RepID=UPI0014749532|nr:hypothetical protein [Brenneria roseae]
MRLLLMVFLTLAALLAPQGPALLLVPPVGLLLVPLPLWLRVSLLPLLRTMMVVLLPAPAPQRLLNNFV